MRLALQLAGSPAAVDVSAEVIWADFETRSEGQRVDALVKMATLGVPRRVLWQRWGATPQEIERWETMLAAEQAAAPPPPAPAPAPPAPEGAPAHDRHPRPPTRPHRPHRPRRPAARAGPADPARAEGADRRGPGQAHGGAGGGAQASARRTARRSTRSGATA